MPEIGSMGWFPLQLARIIMTNNKKEIFILFCDMGPSIMNCRIHGKKF
jgi:hypothetical protein